MPPKWWAAEEGDASRPRREETRRAHSRLDKILRAVKPAVVGATVAPAKGGGATMANDTHEEVPQSWTRWSPAATDEAMAGTPSFPATPGEGPADWKERLDRDGFCILKVDVSNLGGTEPGKTTTNRSEFEAFRLPSRLFGAKAVRAVGPPAEVSDRILGRRGIGHRETFHAHTDGHAYGDLYPDYFLLLCESSSDDGGETFLVDGDAVLQDLREDPATAWVPEALEKVPIDQTSRAVSISPVIQRTEAGRRMLRARLPGKPKRLETQKVAKGSANPAQDGEMIRLFHEAVQRRVDRPDGGVNVKLRPGEALLVDNYRSFHGRNPYSDSSRLLWRTWFWTEKCKGVPDFEFFSDPDGVPNGINLRARSPD